MVTRSNITKFIILSSHKYTLVFKKEIHTHMYGLNTILHSTSLIEHLLFIF